MGGVGGVNGVGVVGDGWYMKCMGGVGWWYGLIGRAHHIQAGQRRTWLGAEGIDVRGCEGPRTGKTDYQAGRRRTWLGATSR